MPSRRSFVRSGSRRCRISPPASSNQADDGILDDFRVHLERGNLLIAARGAPAPAFAMFPTPDWRGRNVERMMPRFIIVARKSATFCRFLSVRGSAAAKGAGYMRPVGFHNAHNLFSVNLDIRLADAVAGFEDGNSRGGREGPGIRKRGTGRMALLLWAAFRSTIIFVYAGGRW